MSGSDGARGADLWQVFSVVPDHRRAEGKRYPLAGLLMIAGGDVGRAVGSTGDRALGPQAEPGGLGGTWNFARSRACAFGVERAFPGAGCGRAGTAPRGLGEGRGRSRTCGD